MVLMNIPKSIRKVWLKLCRNYGLHIPLANFSATPDVNKWVFIVGSYNSGTTLLNELLGTHPDISVLPYEGVSLASKLTRPEDHGWCRMWHKCIDALTLPIEAGQDIADITKREWGLCFDRSKPIFVEKSIVSAVHIPWLIKYFQPAYFIHIVRNGYAVSEGIRRRTVTSMSDSKPYSIDLCATQWGVTNKSIRRDLENYQNKMLVTYEGLTENISSVLYDISRFLEIDYSLFPDIDLLKVHGEISRIENRNKKSIQHLSVDEIVAINNAAKDELEYYGYLQP